MTFAKLPVAHGLTPLLIAVVWCLAACSWSALPSPVQAQSTPDEVLIPEGSFEFRWGDSPIDEHGIPLWTYDGGLEERWQPAKTLFNPPGPAEDYLWLRTRLPQKLPENAAVGTPYILMSFEMYVDSTLIYRSGALERNPTDKYTGGAHRLVRLPRDAEARMLSIRIFSDHEGLIGIPESVYVASELEVLRLLFKDDLDTLVIGIILMVVGIVALLLLVRTRMREHVLLLFYLGLFAFCFGSQYVATHVVSTLVVSAPAIAYYLAALFYLFPVGLLGFFEQMIGGGYRRVIRRLWQAHLALFVVLVMLDVLDVVIIFFASPWFFALLTVSLLAMVATVIPATRRGDPEARIFGAGLILMIILGLHDTVLKGFRIATDAPDLAPWGVLIFMAMLVYLLERRFGENARELRAAHTQLGEYSATLERRVEERTDELAKSLKDLKATQAQLIQSEKLASLGQLTAGIAHEIKNPLNFVKNFSEASVEIADELASELDARRAQPVAEVLGDLQGLLDDLRLNAEKIHTHGVRADGIVRAMMQHARDGEGTRQPTDVNALLDEYVTLAYHGMRANTSDLNVTIERDYEPSVGEVAIVPQDISRVFVNLINNALHAVHERARSGGDSFVPTITVRSRRAGDSIEIQVRDNGVGIPESMRERIFEPFFTTKPAGEGTGLGLSISYDIITQGHGGTLAVESEEGQGTTFTITLPTG